MRKWINYSRSYFRDIITKALEKKPRSGIQALKALKVKKGICMVGTDPVNSNQCDVMLFEPVTDLTQAVAKVPACFNCDIAYLYGKFTSRHSTISTNIRKISKPCFVVIRVSIYLRTDLNEWICSNESEVDTLCVHASKKRHLNTAYQAVQAVDYLMGLEDAVGLVKLKP